MAETWYIMEDGTVGDPALISYNENGMLVHEDGRNVAYGQHGPRSRGCVDADAERAKAREVTADPDEGETTETRELTAERVKRPYKTRESRNT